MTVEKMTTEAIIIAVTEDDRFDWKLNIEANFPVFGSDKNLKFMTWRINQGVAPTDGATVMATITPRPSFGSSLAERSEQSAKVPSPLFKKSLSRSFPLKLLPSSMI